MPEPVPAPVPPSGANDGLFSVRARVAARRYAKLHDIPERECPCSRINQQLLASVIEECWREVRDRDRAPLSAPLAEPGELEEITARLFHETYERLAPNFGYETRRESAVPWERVPEKNRKLMIAVASEVHRGLLSLLDAKTREVEGLRKAATEVYDACCIPWDDPTDVSQFDFSKLSVALPKLRAALSSQPRPAEEASR